MIIQGTSRCLLLLEERGAGGGDTSLRHPELASVRAWWGEIMSVGRGILMSSLARLTLFMLYVILIWPGSISGIFSRVPRSPVWVLSTNNLVIPLEGAEPGSGAITGAHTTHTSWSQGHRGFYKTIFLIFSINVKNRDFIDKYFDARLNV